MFHHHLLPFHMAGHLNWTVTVCLLLLPVHGELTCGWLFWTCCWFKDAGYAIEQQSCWCTVARAALPDQLAEIVDVPQELGMHELDVRRLHSCLKHIRITKQVVWPTLDKTNNRSRPLTKQQNENVIKIASLSPSFSDISGSFWDNMSFLKYISRTLFCQI